MEFVPTIDISRSDALERDSLDRACRDHGFFLLRGHGLDALIDEMWDQTRRFFDAPRAVKEAVRRTEERPLGYYDRELTKQKRDRKEVFDFMEPDGPIGAKRNRWPEELVGFRETQTAL